MIGLTIGKVARSAGLAIDTVRYYERRGLSSKPVIRKRALRKIAAVDQNH